MCHLPKLLENKIDEAIVSRLSSLGEKQQVTMITSLVLTTRRRRSPGRGGNCPALRKQLASWGQGRWKESYAEGSSHGLRVHCRPLAKDWVAPAQGKIQQDPTKTFCYRTGR